NRGGEENRRDKPLTFTGRSQIARPNGEFARLPDDADDILVAEIDPSRALNKQMTDRNHLFADRRPRYYVLD
ncbi:MAG TPA: 5-formyltetrahydrofolate cyclo-ligase, partial [bacterium]|nr:5-formyltetrahydrofolate cyclo-ligase [bacterium]